MFHQLLSFKVRNPSCADCLPLVSLSPSLLWQFVIVKRFVISLLVYRTNSSTVIFLCKKKKKKLSQPILDLLLGSIKAIFKIQVDTGTCKPDCIAFLQSQVTRPETPLKFYWVNLIILRVNTFDIGEFVPILTMIHGYCNATRARYTSTRIIKIHRHNFMIEVFVLHSFLNGTKVHCALQRNIYTFLFITEILFLACVYVCMMYFLASFSYLILFSQMRIHSSHIIIIYEDILFFFCSSFLLFPACIVNVTLKLKALQVATISSHSSIFFGTVSKKKTLDSYIG